MEIINISGDQSNAEYDLKIKSILHLVENTKQIAKRETNSKTLYNLWLSSLENDDAINAFLDFHEEKHIIEDIEEDDKNMLVTYFCVPTENTEYAMLSEVPIF